MKLINLALVLMIFLQQTGCATIQDNDAMGTLAYSAAGGIGGAGIGYATAPEGEKEISHAGLWAAVVVLAVAAYRIIWVHIPNERELSKLRYNNEKIKQMTSSDGTIEFVADEHKKRGQLKGKFKSYPGEDIIPSPKNNGEYLHVIKTYKPVKKEKAQ